MSLLRWAFTLLAFPLGGLLASLAVGPADAPLEAAAAAAVAGAVIGGAQALALGRRTGGWRWIAATVSGMVVGATVSSLATGGETSVLALSLTGLVTGAVVGLAQSLVLVRRRLSLPSRLLAGAVWTATVGLGWAVAWLVTANVIVDAERGFAVFGSSGALVVTAATAIVLRLLLGPAPKRGGRAERPASEAGGSERTTAPATTTLETGR